MTLYEGDFNTVYKVSELYMEEELMRRLQALGLNDGTEVRILNRKKNGSIIIYVRGTRLAIGKHISSNVEVTAEEQ